MSEDVLSGTLRGISATLAALTFVTLSIGLLLAQRANGHAPYPLKVTLLLAWLLSIVGLYAATSHLWTEFVGDAIALVRLFPMAVRTVALILALALAGYYVRLFRRG